MVAFPEGSFAARHSRSLTVVALLFFVAVGGAVVVAWLTRLAGIITKPSY